MTLYHVSEEPDIRVFAPRPPKRPDLDPSVGLVWALCERTLPNFLTPRDCPRVAFHAAPESAEDDVRTLLPPGFRHAVFIEKDWLERLRRTTLYLYEFDDIGFRLQDDCAGYYVAETVQTPVAVTAIYDLETELARRGAALVTADTLWDIADQVRRSTLNWSLCRMAFARARDIRPETEGKTE